MEVFASDSKDLQKIEILKKNKGGSSIDRGLSSITRMPASLKSVLKFRNHRLEYNGYEEPFYNLYEISQAEDVDGIIKRTIKIKRALLAKEGWYLSGKNEKVLNYIKKRFMQISISQNMTMNLFIKNLGGDLIRFHNAYVRIHKTKKRPIGAMLPSSSEEQIVGFTLLPPETMLHKKDKVGNTVAYMQLMPDGRFKKYTEKEIKHFKMNPRSGLTIAPPLLLPAVDDVRALRRIEENVELLIEQHLFPLLIVQIGTDQLPATQLATGESEIENFSKKMETIPATGSMVVSHRHKFELLSSNSVLDVKDYLEHFKKRAYTSAGVSNLDMGEGQGMNRSTADNASKILIDDVKDYQNELKEQIEMYLITPLLLEKYNLNVLLDENRVFFNWNEIDTDSLIKKENNLLVQYQGNLITETEAREGTGRKAMTKSQRKETYSALNATGEKSGAGNLAKSKQQPENQYGKKNSPEKRKSSLDIDTVKIYNILTKKDKSTKDELTSEILEYLLSLDVEIDFLYIYSDFKNSLQSIIENHLNDKSDKYSNSYLTTQQIAYLINNIQELFPNEK